MSLKVNSLTQIASYLCVSPGKITLGAHQFPTRVSSNESVRGFLNIILAFAKESTLNLIPSDAADKAEVLQWIEYALVYGQNGNEILAGLDGVLLTRTYLVANTLTMADVVLFYVMHNTMESLGYLDKEKYVNVCRWFDNLQQSDLLRQKNNLVDFSTSYLSTMAPARH